jgi:hypothetical protein
VVDGLAFVITPDDNKLHSLNAAATEIWTLAEDGCSAARAADRLVECYEVDRETALRDAEQFCADLVERGILVTG